MNVADPQLYEDFTFHPMFRELRANDPVHYCEESEFGPYWAITRYADVHAVDMNHKVFSSAAGGMSIFDAPVDDNSSFIMMDPPQHKAHRTSVTPVFSTKNLNDMRIEVKQRVERILDKVPTETPFDWVDAVANQLPVQMLATLFGIPEADTHHMLYWTNVQVALIGGQQPDASERDQHPSFTEYFLALRRQREAEGVARPDLVSHLVMSGAEVSDRMFLNHLRLLMVGANDTTRTSIAGSLEAVIRQGLYDTLRADRSLLPTAVTEMIRLVTPVVHQRRTALEDFELNGKQIHAGDKVVMFYVSANRDEAAFDRPDELVLDRTEPRPLSFGSGVHHCIGFRLAQMQMEYMWEGMLDRFSGFELAGDIQRLRSNFVQGYNSMPVIAHA